MAATALLAKIDRKRRDRWSETIRSIDFSHFEKHGAFWTTLIIDHNTLLVAVPFQLIESQLVRNGRYEIVDRKSSRLVSQEVSDLWEATTPNPVNIFEDFSQREFTIALQHLKPGKAPVSDFIFSELL